MVVGLHRLPGLDGPYFRLPRIREPEALRQPAAIFPQAFQQFQKAQDGLGSALSRLMVVVEKYPELKSNQNFLDLQAQLEGTENRITVARMQFNEQTQTFNILIRRFPGSMIAAFSGFHELQYFQAVTGSEKPPQVKF